MLDRCATEKATFIKIKNNNEKSNEKSNVLYRLCDIDFLLRDGEFRVNRPESQERHLNKDHPVLLFHGEARQSLRGDRPCGGKRLCILLEQAAGLRPAEAGAEAAGGRHRERQVFVHSRPADRNSVRGRGLGEV